jgi:hypothetical protein
MCSVRTCDTTVQAQARNDNAQIMGVNNHVRRNVDR